jgi:hypothetical protein
MAATLRYGIQRTGAHASRFNRGKERGPDQAAGIITIAARAKKNDIPDRKNNIGKKDRSLLMGTDLGLNNMHGNIGMREILITPVVNVRSSGMESMAAPRNIVYSGLNGTVKSPSGNPNITQEEYEAGYQVVGAAYSTRDNDEGHVQTDEVAVAVAGILTVENNGNTFLRIGDDAEWILPNVDEAMRLEELKHLPELSWRSKEKLTVILRRQTYETATRFIHSAITHSFTEKNEKYSNNYYSLLHPLQKQSLPHNIRIALGARALTNLAGLITVGTLLEYDMIQFKDVNLNKTDFKALDADQRANMDKLAALLGFHHAPGMASHPGVMDIIARRALRGMITDDAEYTKGEVESLFTERANLERISSTMDSLYEPKKTIDAVERAVQHAAADLYLATIHAKTHADARIVGKVYDDALPGGAMQLLLRNR